MDAALILVRLAGFASGAALFGAPMFVVYSGLADQMAPKQLKPVLIAAGALSAAAAVAALIVQTGQMAGDASAGLDPATLRDVITGGGFGGSVLVRIGAALMALTALNMLRPGRDLWAGTAALGAIGLAALAWSGHGAADEGLAGIVHTGTDVAHLLASGIWLGALLIFVLRLCARAPNAAEVEALHRALKGFSGVGSIVVAAIIASGLVNSWFLVGPDHLGGIATSLWGELLILKLGLFAAMLMLATINRYRLTPQLEAALPGDPRMALSALRCSVAVESAAGLGVLALVACLGLLVPPASM